MSAGARLVRALHGHKGQLLFLLLMPGSGTGGHAAQMEMNGSTNLSTPDVNNHGGFRVIYDAFWYKQCPQLLGYK